MDRQSQELFDTLVKREPAALTSNEAAFLNARREYLDQEQRKTFAGILTKEEGGLAELSNKELVKLIESKGLEVPKNANKETLLKVLEDAEALEEANKDA
jgi:hypothetical protein